MAEYTDNFNLIKPGQDEFYNVEIFNNNADIIDAELKNLKNTIENLNADGITLPDGKTISEKFTEITKEIGNTEELDTETKLSLVAAINEINQALVAHKADYMQHTSYAIATGTNSYAVNIDGVTSLVEGMSIKVKFQNANTGTATLNINGLGAKEIRKSNGNSLSAGNIKAGQIAHLVYTGSVFQLLGEGGEYGTAQPNHVLEGITFGTEDGLKVGTMPNRGGVNQTLTTQGGTYIIPEGYHDGTGTVKAQFANLIASNIRNGVNIGGIVGSYRPTIYMKTDSRESSRRDVFLSISPNDPTHNIAGWAIEWHGRYDRGAEILGRMYTGTGQRTSSDVTVTFNANNTIIFNHSGYSDATVTYSVAAWFWY